MSKSPQVILFLISLILLALGYSLLYPENVGICGVGERDCIVDLAMPIGQPLFIGMIFVTLVSLSLIFVTQRALTVWKKFAMFYIPIATVWIVILPINCSDSLGLCFQKENGTWFAGIVYLIVSLLIIITVTVRERKNP